MKCKVKINDLYLKDFDINLKSDNNLISSIQLDSKKYYECESGEEAMFLKSVIVQEFNIPEENIQAYAIE